MDRNAAGNVEFRKIGLENGRFKDNCAKKKKFARGS